MAKVRRLLGACNVLSVVAGLVIAFGSAQLVAGALTTGLGEDEPIHADRIGAWVHTGWYVPTYWQVDGEPDPESQFSTPWVYGPAYQVLAHAVNIVAGNDHLGFVARDADGYAVRHLVNALLALLAVAAVGAAVCLLTRSRTLGLWAAAGLLAVPAFTGYAFFTPKDIPAAAGYTLLVVALLFALIEEPGKPVSRRRTLAVAAGVAFGIAIGAGTRLALWLPFAIALGTYAALRLGQARLGGVARDGATDFVVGAAALIGFLAIGALYPEVASTPLELLVESVIGSADYFNLGDTLTAGSELSVQDPPFWYLPAWVGATYPLLLGALALLGAGAAVWALARARGAVWSRRDLGLVLVLQQAYMLPIAVILAGSPAYNGLRQHLYVLPALAILAGIGAWRLLGWARSRERARAWTPLTIAALCLALIVPMAAQTALFPYNYTFFNPLVALTGGVDGRWETDYRWTSRREALARVPEGVPLRCSAYLEDDTPEPGDEIDYDGCGGDPFEIFREERGTDLAPGALRGPPSVWVLGRNREAKQPPPYCEQFDDITRWLWGETVTISYVLRCDPAEVAAQERRDEREAEEEAGEA